MVVDGCNVEIGETLVRLLLSARFPDVVDTSPTPLGGNIERRRGAGIRAVDPVVEFFDEGLPDVISLVSSSPHTELAAHSEFQDQLPQLRHRAGGVGELVELVEKGFEGHEEEW